MHTIKVETIDAEPSFKQVYTCGLGVRLLSISINAAAYYEVLASFPGPSHAKGAWEWGYVKYMYMSYS